MLFRSPTRSRAGLRRSCETSWPSGCWACRSCAEGDALNFDYTDDQQAIKSTAREFLADRFKLEKVRQLAEAGEYDEALWGEMSELGWPGIFVGEEHGGQGLGVLELGILMEEMG